jgi:hypothetical protein
VISFERELEALRPHLGEATDPLLARERRQVFSVHPELRLLAWAGSLMIAGAAGVLLKNNLDRIGPVVLAVAIALASAACYAWAWWHRARSSFLDDYFVLLGALLLSADVAFVESQFHLLGAVWHRHFLVLAILHGVAAYAFGSRLVLSLAVTALAAWLGVEQKDLLNFELEPTEFAMRAFGSAVVILAWRFLNRRDDFAPVFEHFAANLALSGALALTFHGDRIYGTGLTLAVAAVVIAWGFRSRREWFVLYAMLYAVCSVDVLLIEWFGGDEEGMIVVLVSLIVAIALLFAIHRRFRELEP